MGPARTLITDGSSKTNFRDRRSALRARTPAAECYAKLSKLPKLYMVTPRDRQDNGRRNATISQQKSKCVESPNNYVPKLIRTKSSASWDQLKTAAEIC